MKILGFNIYTSSYDDGFNIGWKASGKNIFNLVKELERGHKKYPKTINYKFMVKAIKNLVKIYKK